MSVLIWVQTVCKGCQQTTKVSPPFITNVICSLRRLCTLVSYIAINMGPDQTAYTFIDI